MATLYKRRIEQGLCGGCGKPNENSGSLCDDCKEKCRLRAAATRAKRKTGGLCIQCGEREPKPGSRRCSICLKSQREARAEKVEEFRQAGLCNNCGQVPPKKGCVLCQKCMDRGSRISSKHYRQRKAAGTCAYCSQKPLKGETLCEYHKDLYRGYRVRLKLAAFDAYGGPICAGCGSTDVEVLEIDHIEGGGRKHFREEHISSGTQFHQWLKRNNYPAGFRILCPTCNKKAYAGIPLPNEA